LKSALLSTSVIVPCRQPFPFFSAGRIAVSLTMKKKGSNRKINPRKKGPKQHKARQETKEGRGI
jgi:hypothetical protein